MFFSGLILFLLWFYEGNPPQEVPAEAQPVSPYVEKFEKSFKFYPGGKIALEAGLPGSFKILGWDKATVAMEAEKIFYRPEAREIADQFTVRVRYTDTSATLQTLGPPGTGAAVEVNGTIYVPKHKTDFKILLAQGDLEVRNVNGWFDVDLAGGSLAVESIEGYFSVVTKSGDLAIQLSGKRWRGHGLTAFTHFGQIDIRIPAEYHAAIQMETRDGEMKVDYPEQLVDGEWLPLTITTRRNGKSLSASLGDGGAPIRLKTEKGNVSLATSQAP